MYNRYIQQPDGSYQRSRMVDRSRPQEQPQKPLCPPNPEPCREEAGHRQPCPNNCPAGPKRPVQKNQEPAAMGIGSFLRQLLPRGFDTADLIVVLLLLLISADSGDDNSALLTLVIYLFL